jgi:hypothetical protein
MPPWLDDPDALSLLAVALTLAGAAAIILWQNWARRDAAAREAKRAAAESMPDSERPLPTTRRWRPWGG